jgi:uncharacterized protein YbaP (TraB family)
VRGEKGTLYLQGSVHFLKPDIYPLHPRIEQAFELSDVVVFEIDMGPEQKLAAASLAMRKGLLTDGRTLKDVLTAETYKLAADTALEVGMPMSVVGSMEPWLFGMTLSVMRLQQLGYDPEKGLDTYFYDRAVNAGKKTMALETVEAQLGFLDELTDQDALLRQMLQDFAVADEQMDEIMVAWKTGDAEALNEVLVKSMREFPTVYDRLLVKRNQAWLPELEKLLASEHTTMVLVGAAHLVGPDGLLRALARKGYAIEQL